MYAENVFFYSFSHSLCVVRSSTSLAMAKTGTGNELSLCSAAILENENMYAHSFVLFIEINKFLLVRRAFHLPSTHGATFPYSRQPMPSSSSSSVIDERNSNFCNSAAIQN